MSSGFLQGASYWIAAEANSGVVAPWVLPGLRMACYYAADAAQMETWFSSAGLGDAIEDGSSWFDNFHRLDGQLFTGNVYEFAGGRPSERRGDAVLVDRWESGEETPGGGTLVEAAQRYCNTLADLGGVVCSTVWRSVRVARGGLVLPLARQPHGLDGIRLARSTAIELGGGRAHRGCDGDATVHGGSPLPHARSVRTRVQARTP